MDIRYSRRPALGPLFCHFWPGLKLLSWDVNQTLVAENTMVALAGLAGHRKRAQEIVEAQTAGRRPVETTLKELARLTAGLPLEDIVSYVCSLPELPGLRLTLKAFCRAGLIQIINSTGYTVVLSLWNKILQRHLGEAPFSKIIANRLRFEDSRGEEVPEEEVLETAVALLEGKRPQRDLFVSGDLDLVISAEEAKAVFLEQIIRQEGLFMSEVAHIGDSMGDSEVIAWMAKNGGLGLAFNARPELVLFLERLSERRLPGQAVIVSSSDLRDLAPVILGETL
ncbi:hypothetical protein [Thermosulfuriphilus sp.]